MFEQLFNSIGFIVAAAIVVALIWIPLNWRSPVSLKRRFVIKADPETVWKAMSLEPGRGGLAPALEVDNCSTR